ncbi:hypothetical protein Ahy_A06g026354 [Arachis hypogaea]|uniref:SWIM-type domain-containing protein n=1 Tax=Arachis hypogaea TaxID=3818 RepID=A0A445CK73_ARAHY|nr:hypothetical protein Ahy_A06g026354 [Arachis hypogaea]
METLMDIMFHHGGTFKKNDDGISVYSPDNRTCLGDLDEDTLDVFFVRNYYKELGYDNIIQCWWLPPGRSLDGGLRALTCDGELREMCFAAQKNDRVVDVYFEHGVSTPEVIAGKEVVVWLDDTCEGDLVSKKNTSEGPKSDGNTSNLTIESNPIPNANPSPQNNPIPTPPETIPVTIPNPIDDNTTPILKPNSKSKPNPTSISKPKLTEKSIQKLNPILKTKLRETTKACSTAKAVGTYKRSINKGKEALHVDLTVNDDSSDDDSSEDSFFKPIQEDSSSSEDNASMSKSKLRNRKLKEVKRDYEKFEVHGHPTNMVVDLGKRLCTCQFWMLTGIPCVHACVALVRINKRSEDFCHQLCTMEAYNNTYAHHINPLSGQSLWEKSMYTQPQAPNIRRRPGALTKKRRKDVDEGNSGNKKAKPSGSLKRILKQFTCRYCGVKGHTKRECSKKRLDEVAVAVAAAKAAADKVKSKAASEAGPKPHIAASALHAGPQPQTTTSASDFGPQPHTAAAPVDKPPAVEIEISQPNYEGSQDIAGSTAPAPSRPKKLPTKRRTSPPPQSIRMDPMLEASEATTFRLANFMKFVPTLSFRAPRKKNNS